MFEAPERRSLAPWVILAGVLLAGAVAGVPHAGVRARVLLAGHDPRPPPFTEVHVDFPVDTSPFAAALALDDAATPEARARMLTAADAVAGELGWWLLSETGTTDVHAAESALWARDHDPDALAQRWARELRVAGVYSRPAFGVHFDPAPDHSPTYVHPDELLWVFLHVAWRLDLRASVVPSPVHWYVLLREPGGAGVRGVETTCFRCPDDAEPSVGLRLTFAEDFYPSGVGGIRNPEPLPPGTYVEVAPDALAGITLASVERRSVPDLPRLAAHLRAHPTDAGVAELLFRSALDRGVDAARAGRWDEVTVTAEALAELRREHPDLAPPHRDDRVLDAALAFHAGDGTAAHTALRRVLSYRDAEWGPVEAGKAIAPGSDAHDLALWLALEHGDLGPSDWNLRVVPLLTKHHGDPVAVDRLCGFGRRALQTTTSTVEDAYPGCAGH
jgi:hypothetical protein